MNDANKLYIIALKGTERSGDFYTPLIVHVGAIKNGS
jgi:hypothetical protein